MCSLSWKENEENEIILIIPFWLERKCIADSFTIQKKGNKNYWGCVLKLEEEKGNKMINT